MNEKNNIKIENLIEEIKNKGINEGKRIAKEIIENATKEAKTIIENAEEESKKKINITEEECLKKKNSNKKEIELACRDFIINFQQNFKNNFILQLIKDKVLEELTNTENLKDLIKDIAIEYIKNTKNNIIILVSEKIKNSLNNFFIQEIKNKTNNSNIEFKISNNLDGFKIINSEEKCTFDFSLETISEEILNLIDNKTTPKFKI